MSGLYDRRMRIMAASCSLLLLVIGTAGCSKSESDGSSPAPSSTEATSHSIPQASGEAPVANADWRAVIDDWYDNGVLDELHSCAAVRTAVERLPRSSPNPHTAFEDLGRYEARKCDG